MINQETIKALAIAPTWEKLLVQFLVANCVHIRNMGKGKLVISPMSADPNTWALATAISKNFDVVQKYLNERGFSILEDEGKKYLLICAE
jgi:hypothetical protein